MKLLDDFMAFRLEKSQMTKLAGGRVICQVYYNDGLGGSFVQAYETNDRQAMEEALQAQHPDGKADCWYPA
jgi:hypothetical protein